LFEFQVYLLFRFVVFNANAHFVMLLATNVTPVQSSHVAPRRRQLTINSSSAVFTLRKRRGKIEIQGGEPTNPNAGKKGDPIIQIASVFRNKV